MSPCTFELFTQLLYQCYVHKASFCLSIWSITESVHWFSMFTDRGRGGAVPDSGWSDHNCRASSKRLHPRWRQWASYPTSIRQTCPIQTHREWPNYETYQKTCTQAHRNINSCLWLWNIYVFNCGRKCPYFQCVKLENSIQLVVT